MDKSQLLEFVKEELTKEKTRLLQDLLTSRFDALRSTIKKYLIISGFLGLGVFFLILGVAKYLSVILNISEGAAFIVFGLILLLIGLIYRAGAKS